MGSLFTDPVVCNDGTIDRSYTHINDTEDNTSQITLRTNMATAVVEKDQIIVKQSKVRSPIRAVIIKPKSVLIADTDGQRDDNIWNLSLKTTDRIPESVIQAELEVLLNAAQKQGFVAGLIHAKS